MPILNTFGLRRPNPALNTNLDDEEIEQWEDSAKISSPPEEMTGATDDAEDVGMASMSDDYGNVPSGLPASSFDRYRAALDKRAAQEMARPQRSDYKPKGWQRALAAVANFGAGYVNAGGRTRVDPGSMKSINESLLRPGYRGAMERWEDTGRQTNIELDSAGREVQMDTAQKRAENEAQRTAAYGEAQKKSGALAQRRLEKLDEDEWKISPTGRYMYNPRTGEKKEMEAPKSPGPVKETPSEARIRRRDEAASMKHLTDEQRETYELTGKIPVIKPPAKGGKGGSGKPRMGTPGQFRGVEKEKQIALSKAEAAYRKVIKDSTSTDDDKATALADLEAEKQRIMDAYDAGVETLGGEVIPRGKKPAASTAAPAPAPAAGGPKYDEKTVRDSAIKAGKDPEFVVSEMKKRGLL